MEQRLSLLNRPCHFTDIRLQATAAESEPAVGGDQPMPVFVVRKMGFVFVGNCYIEEKVALAKATRRYQRATRAIAGPSLVDHVPWKHPDCMKMIQCTTQKALSLWHTRRLFCYWCVGFWLRYLLASWRDAAWECDYQRWKKARLDPQPEESTGQARLGKEEGTPASESGGR